jgi:hypothetical protein
MKNTNRGKGHLIWLAGLISGVVFIALIGIRLDVFTIKKAPESLSASNATDRESWMDIFRKEQKIGYTHRRLSNKETGFELHDNTYLRLNVMGMIQDMRIQTTAFLNRDFSLSSFTFDLGSGLFDISATGHITEKSLRVVINGQENTFHLKNPVFLLSGLFDAAAVKSLSPGDTTTFHVFDPATMGQSQVRLTLEGNDTLSIMGKPVKTTRYAVEYMGLTQKAWLDEQSNIVQETGMMGIKLVKSTRQAVLEGFQDSVTEDLTESISVVSNRRIPAPAGLATLILTVGGTGDVFFLDGGRQAFKDGVLTIIREDIPRGTDVSRPATMGSDAGRSDAIGFLKPTLTIQSDHPKIRQLAADLVPADTPPPEAARNIMAWIFENIEKRPVISIPNALETLENRMGDCNEHAVLFAALARAAKIPVQVEAGLVYLNGRFYYHAWNVVHIGDWVTVDALMGQMPADVTHIRLVRGDEMNQLDLVHAIDSIRLNILEMQ